MGKGLGVMDQGQFPSESHDRDLACGGAPAPAAWRWLVPRGRWSYLAIGSVFGLYAGTLLWATQQRSLIILLAVALCVGIDSH